MPPVNPARVPTRCHPSTRHVNPAPRCAKRGPPVGSGASDRAIFGTTPRSAMQRQNARAPTWCHPSVRHRQPQHGATRQFVSGRIGRDARNSARGANRCHPRNSATRQFGSPPTWCHPPTRRANWCHPPVRHAGSSPADSAGKPETVPPRFSCSRMVPPVSLPVSLPNVRCHPPIRGAVAASSRRACPPRVAPVRPL